MSVGEPGWLPDPMGRHEFRWWDGTAWSDIVADHGVETVDRLDAYQPAAPPSGAGRQPHPGPASAVAPSGHATGSAAHPPGDGTDARSASTASNRQIALVAAIGVAALVAVGIVAVVVNRGGESDGADAATGNAATAADPRAALLSIDDLPADWQETETPPGLAENLICEQGIESDDPPREAEANFGRAEGSAWLSHVVFEASPQHASDVVGEHARQAGQCGTFEDVNTVSGETWRSTITAEVVTGPTFGDETLWYMLHIENEVPQTNRDDFLRCLDRHDGVISAVTLSTRAPLSDADRTLVEDLCRAAADRLQG